MATAAAAAGLASLRNDFAGCGPLRIVVAVGHACLRRLGAGDEALASDGCPARRSTPSRGPQGGGRDPPRARSYAGQAVTGSPVWRRRAESRGRRRLLPRPQPPPSSAWGAARTLSVQPEGPTRAWLRIMSDPAVPAGSPATQSTRSEAAHCVATSAAASEGSVPEQHRPIAGAAAAHSDPTTPAHAAGEPRKARSARRVATVMEEGTGPAGLRVLAPGRVPTPSARTVPHHVRAVCPLEN